MHWSLCRASTPELLKPRGTNTKPTFACRQTDLSGQGYSFAPSARKRCVIVIMHRPAELGRLLLPCWAHCYSTRDRYDRRVSYGHQFLSAFVRFDTTYLGFTRCVRVKTVPSKMQRPPTTTYAMPKKGFLPPITVRVEMRMDLVPPYFSTGKPNRSQQQAGCGKSRGGIRS
jgi:hypothetical protein